MDLLLGIDAGTTSIKAGIFSTDGKCMALRRREYVLDTPAADRAQLDPEIYWQSCSEVVREVVGSIEDRTDSIKALAVSSQGETLITLDKKGQVLYPAIVWLDNRATMQAEGLKEKYQSVVYKMTGIPEIIATWPACKIMWLEQNAPEVFSKVDKFLLVQDYLIYRLTGRFVTDGSISCTTMYFNIREGNWWKTMLDELDITTAQLPEIVPPGTAIGNLKTEIAQAFQLPSTVQVVAGGMDQSVGAIGVGNISDGVFSETTGAALAIQVTIADPDIDQKQHVPVYVHSVPGKYLFVPVCPTAGMALKWFKETFGNEENQQALKDNVDAYNLMTRLAEEVPPGCDGLVMLPHLMGAFSPEPNSAARGSFTGFTLSHSRGHFIRALLEGVAFMLRQNLEMIHLAGVQVGEILSTGGGARSRLWCQIKADVCRMPVSVPEIEETGLLGDAILAGVAAGLFDSIEAGCRVMVRGKDNFKPTANVMVYELAYQRFCELDRNLAKYYHQEYS